MSKDDKIRQIDFWESDRVETGAIQFGEEDWPGIFIRGDDCIAFSIALEGALMKMQISEGVENILIELPLTNLLNLLKSSRA